MSEVTRSPFAYFTDLYPAFADLTGVNPAFADFVGVYPALAEVTGLTPASGGTWYLPSPRRLRGSGTLPRASEDVSPERRKVPYTLVQTSLFNFLTFR